MSHFADNYRPILRTVFRRLSQPLGPIGPPPMLLSVHHSQKARRIRHRHLRCGNRAVLTVRENAEERLQWYTDLAPISPAIYGSGAHPPYIFYGLFEGSFSHIDQAIVENDDPVPFGALLLFAGIPILPAFGRCNT